MRKTMTVLVVALVAVAFLTGLALAAAGPAEAKAWVKKAVEYYQAYGKTKALAEFSNPKGQFVKDNLYIYVLDLNGKMLAHPKGSLVGRDFTKIKDPNGKPFAVDIVNDAKANGSGWINYKWEHPATKKPAPKTVYFEKVDDVVICSGVYTK
jgi:cytochrome c